MTLRKKASQVITPTSFRSRITEAFDPFLLESVGVEENGMTVSVLSTLARLGLDPWEEAGRLAVLPKKAAIAVITHHLSLKGDSLIAARLAELLPEASKAPRDRSPMGSGHGVIRRNPLLWLAFWLVSCIFFMILQPSHPVADTAQTVAPSSSLAAPAR
jgi:hypothetical protein